jgi:hypothetical protein
MLLTIRSPHNPSSTPYAQVPRLSDGYKCFVAVNNPLVTNRSMLMFTVSTCQSPSASRTGWLLLVQCTWPFIQHSGSCPSQMEAVWTSAMPWWQWTHSAWPLQRTSYSIGLAAMFVVHTVQESEHTSWNFSLFFTLLQANARPAYTINSRRHLSTWMLFCMGVKLGRSQWGRYVGWGCLRIGCWREYFDLRGTRKQGSGENYIRRKLMLCTPHPIFYRWSNREELDGLYM